MPYVAWLENLSRRDVPDAGGKGANLGEMLRAGLPVPPGFVVTADGFRAFLHEAGLEERIARALKGLNVDDSQALGRASEALQGLVMETRVPAAVRAAISEAYSEMSRRAGREPLVAVRSSATMEDTAQFSFAGMFRSFLNVRGSDELIRSVRQCWASLFAPRALFYRVKQNAGVGEQVVAVVVQQMVDAEKAGVFFTINPATGDTDELVIETAWGLGEVVVGGQVQPDHVVVSKRAGKIIERTAGRKEFELVRDPQSGATVRRAVSPERIQAHCLSDTEILALAELARRDEEHYGAPQDGEFAIAGGRIYLVQTRPVTTLKPRAWAAETPASAAGAQRGEELVRGLGASPGIAVGAVRVLTSPEEGGKLKDGEVLVTRMTKPDWVPLMRRASAIVTDEGGMTSHAAIVSRELGVPCVVGAQRATTSLSDGLQVTVDGHEGVVFRGEARPVTPPKAERKLAPARAVAPVTGTRLYVNLGEPARAAEVAALDVDGVGLLRAEFMILEALQGKHPRLLVERGQRGAMVERLVASLRVMVRAFHPRPVVYRTMDFRSNEFRGLEGGERFEPAEENPMIGYRGCFRYTREADLFGIELEVIRKVRAELPNLHVMIPFVRTASEFLECKRLIDESGLRPGNDLQLWVMAEVPSVVYWIPTYARSGVSGVSIGSNDLTQLMLGVDRDSQALAPLFDERDPSVLAAIRSIIRRSHQAGLTCSICGQAPSVYPEYAALLVGWGIDSISVVPDALERTRHNIAAAEQALLLRAARRRPRRRI
ncbi:MAG: phosphoenolpyruvate synthase [Deltaproteobacteria bacterium]|nr:phosphoenolpyruvate synthase [Deltaproteobacteria bacterium]